MSRPFALIISVFTAGLLAGGCARNIPPYEPPIDSGYGLQIKRGYDNLPNYTRLYFQQGARIDEKMLERWTTHCHLHVFNRDKNADHSISIAPGRFEITGVKLRYQSSEYPYYGIQAGDTLVGFGLIGDRASPEYGWRRDGPPSYYLYRIEMRLGSATQPEVQSLTCSRKWSTRGSYYPSLDDMREALGDIIEIIPPA